MTEMDSNMSKRPNILVLYADQMRYDQFCIFSL